MSALDKHIWNTTADDPGPTTTRGRFEEAVMFTDWGEQTSAQIAAALIADRPTLARVVIACLVEDVRDEFAKLQAADVAEGDRIRRAVDPEKYNALMDAAKKRPPAESDLPTGEPGRKTVS